MDHLNDHLSRWTTVGKHEGKRGSSSERADRRARGDGKSSSSTSTHPFPSLRSLFFNFNPHPLPPFFFSRGCPPASPLPLRPRKPHLPSSEAAGQAQRAEEDPAQELLPSRRRLSSPLSFRWLLLLLLGSLCEFYPPFPLSFPVAKTGLSILEVIDDLLESSSSLLGEFETG